MNSRPKLNILVALPYCDPPFQELVSSNPDIRFLLDSGAFTAWKKGEEITLDRYCNFLESLKSRPWKYFMLDKIGDPVTTKRNLKELNRRGLNLHPVAMAVHSRAFAFVIHNPMGCVEFQHPSTRDHGILP